MDRGPTHVFRTTLRLAVRRVVVSLVMLCLAFGPLVGALSTHHVDDPDNGVEVAESFDHGGAVVKAAKTVVVMKKVPSHPADLPLVDHDCHGCSTAMIDKPSEASPVYLPRFVQQAPVHLVEGRVPGAEFRPPKA